MKKNLKSRIARGGMMLSRVTFLMFLMLTSEVYSVVNNETRYTVINHQARLYKDSTLSHMVTTVPCGFVFTMLGQTKTRVQLEYNGQKMWIDIQDIEEINFTSQKFSETSTLYVDTPIIKGSELWFCYKDNLYKMNVKDSKNPTIALQASIPSAMQLKSSLDKKLWVLVGDDNDASRKILKIALFYLESRQFSPLTIFDAKKVIIKSIEFSPNKCFLAILINDGQKNHLLVYNTNTGISSLVKMDVLDFIWFNNKLVVYRSQDIGLYISNKENQWQDKIILYVYPKPVKTVPSVSFTETNLFMELDKNIYRIKSNDLLEKTTLISLESSELGAISRDKDNVRYKGKIIRPLSGPQAKWTLISIINDDTLLYKQQNHSVTTIYMYDAKNNISKALKWIEDPQHILPDNTIIEVIVDKKEVWFFVEKPGEWVQIVQLHKLL